MKENGRAVDKSIQEGDRDQDAAEIRVGKVILEVDTEQNVLEDAGNDKENVEL
jgi:hypothetical protein